MAYRDLRDFLRTLEKKGELKRISAEVDPVLEITEITDRAVKAGGPALLFEKPKGSRIPVVTNLVGTERRMNLALEVESLDEVAERIHSFLDMQSPQGLFEKMKMLPKLAELGSFFPKTVRAGSARKWCAEKDFSLELFSDLAVLAAGRRALHHVADGDYEESGNGQAQCGLLSDAGV